MIRTLLLYSSTDGHTRKIATRIAEGLEHHGAKPSLVAVEHVDDIDLSRFDAAIVGAPVRYGKHDRRIVRFLELNAATLERMPNAFFSVNLIARTPAKRSAESNSHVRKFLDRLAFKPAWVEVFPGRLDYPSYGWLDRFAIRMIMKMTGGPAQGSEIIDFTDWTQVDDFAARMARDFSAAINRT